MELMNLSVRNFKRFEENSNLRLNGKVIALIGPNEAGKSSLLQALKIVGNNEELEDGFKTYGVEDKASITLSFALTAAELDELSIKSPSWYQLTKTSAGEYTHTLKPRIQRNETYRKKALSKIKSVLKSTKTTELLKTIAGEASHEILTKGQEVLVTNNYTYSDLELSELEEMRSLFDDSFNQECLKSMANCGEVLDDLIEFEKNHNPHGDALKSLGPKTPNFLLFEYSDRDLQVPFSIVNLKNNDPAKIRRPSKSLQKILDLAEIDIDQLGAAMRERNAAKRRSIVESGNMKLNSLLQNTWSQSDAKIKIEASDSFVDIIVEHPEFDNANSKFVNFNERSDGYKQFTALAVFALLEGNENSILLIDEAETHLHYDAQADLIQILTKQFLSKKVIYTTHSAGCLPEDLGNGVRLIEWDREKKDRSRIRNKFWSLGASQGFTPLLLGMGATTFSFFPTRNAVITEGVSEMILLAPLLREACALDNLGFQIVPGLSEASKAQLPLMDRSGKGVAYIVDNDAGGEQLSKVLLKSGIEKERIKKISSGKKIRTLEDCIDSKVWKSAVEKYIDLRCDGKVKVSSWPTHDRIKNLPKAIRAAKIELAYIILDMKYENPNLEILDKKSKTHFRNMYTQLCSIFEV